MEIKSVINVDKRDTFKRIRFARSLGNPGRVFLGERNLSDLDRNLREPELEEKGILEDLREGNLTVRICVFLS